ncbi:MAG: hypothetical protein ABIB71_09190 [Candidatus Woesearchaeota archaeon]
MTNISKDVRRILMHDLALQKCLAYDLINMTALAKFIKDRYKVNASNEAIVSAIRRFDVGKLYSSHSSIVHEAFFGARISTKTNLAAVEIVGKSNIAKILPRIKEIIDLDKNDILRIITGNARMRIIIDQNKANKLLELLPKRRQIIVRKNLVEMIVSTNPKIDIDETKGVIAKLANELSMNNINIVEIIFSTPDVLVYVDQKDYQKAHGVLLELKGIKQNL